MSGTVANRQHAVKSDDRTAGGRALSALAVQVFRLEGLLAASGDALAAPSGQTTARWRVLAAVERAPLTVAQIARAWSLARQSVQRVADLLARDGLVAYEPNPGHQRAKLLRLTPAGAAVLGRIQQAQGAWADDLGGRLDAGELERASAILAGVIDAIDRR
jgi:DNA-binding MarR family transcriptional regulator